MTVHNWNNFLKPSIVLPNGCCQSECVFMLNENSPSKIAVYELFISQNHFGAKCRLKAKKEPELSIVWAQLFLSVVVNSPQRLGVRSIAAISFFCQDSLSFTACLSILWASPHSISLTLNWFSFCFFVSATIKSRQPKFCVSLGKVWLFIQGLLHEHSWTHFTIRFVSIQIVVAALLKNYRHVLVSAWIKNADALTVTFQS